MMKSKKVLVSYYKIIGIITITYSMTLLLNSCSGCSQSGMKNYARKHAKQTYSSKYPKNIPSNEYNESNNETASPNLPLNKLFKKYKSAVFMVFTSDGVNGYQGSGFFISSNGIAISNYHVFKGTTKGLETIRTYNGIDLKVDKVIDKSENDDYIIFKVRLNNSVTFNPIPIAYQQPEIGEDVFAIGNPMGLEHTLSKGIVSAYRENYKYIQTTTEITHGSSGGPLLNMKGEAVGITTSGLGEANINFAVNIKYLPLYKYLK